MINSKQLKNSISDFEKIINYEFRNKNNIIMAFTHSSYSNENKNEKLMNNERLEFLGDSVLNITVSEFLYKNYPNLSEGEMTKIRASVVCENTLMTCSSNIRAGDFLLLGKGEEQTGGRKRSSILSDVFEAIIGAIYIDDGLESAKKFILSQLKQHIENAVKGFCIKDYKTQLQEMVQKNGDVKIAYEVISENGPDHDKVFVTQVSIQGAPYGTGKGKSKKEAEQNAAKEAIEKVKSKG